MLSIVSMFLGTVETINWSTPKLSFQWKYKHSVNEQQKHHNKYSTVQKKWGRIASNFVLFSREFSSNYRRNSERNFASPARKFAEIRKVNRNFANNQNEITNKRFFDELSQIKNEIATKWIFQPAKFR